MGPLYLSKWFQDTIQVNSSHVVSSDNAESIFLTVTSRRDRNSSPETGSGKGTRPGFYSQLFLVPKKDGKLRPVIDLSLLNLYIKKQPFKLETVKSVSHSIVINDWAVSTDLTDAYLHVPIHPQSRKYLRFMYKDQIFQFTALPFGMSLSSLIFTKLMDIIASHLCQCAISVFLYLDNWLIRDLIRSPLLSQTIYCLQIVQSLGFIPNLKKSELIPTENFMFIGMEFLSLQNLVRVPADRVKALILTIKTVLSCNQVLARTFLSLLSSRFCSPRQTSLMTSANVSFVCLETSHSSSRSSDHDQQYDSISFELVDGHQSFRTRNFHSSSRHKCIPLCGCQPLWMGSSSRADETTFHGRWWEDQSQLHISMLEMMAIHFALKKAIKCIHHACVMISTDNTTVVSYINKQGGTHSPNLCIEIWEILH